MLRLTNQGLVSLLLVGCLPNSWAAGASIGIARADGSFHVDGSEVTGNATVFSGSSIRTGEASSRLTIGKSVRVEIGPESSAKVYDNRISLEAGSTQVAALSPFRIEARTMRIESAGANAVAHVGLHESNSVLVAAANGPLRIYNELGFLVANVNAGVAISVTPGTAAQADSSVLTGCLTKVGDRYLLNDTTASLVVELRGANLEENAGKVVEISGARFRTAQPAAGASQVIRVGSIKMIASSCPAATPASKPSQGASTGAKAAKTGTEAAKAGAKTKSNGTTIALIALGGGGAAVAGIVLGTRGSKSR